MPDSDDLPLYATNDTVEAYDPVTNFWVVRGAMSAPRAGFGVGVIGSLAYAVGGRNSTSVLATNQRYTP